MFKCNLCVIKLNMIINRKWLYLCSEARRDKPPSMWHVKRKWFWGCLMSPRNRPALGLMGPRVGAGATLHTIVSLFRLFERSFSSILETLLYHLSVCHFPVDLSPASVPAFYLLLSSLARIAFLHLNLPLAFWQAKIKAVHLIFSQNRCWVIDPHSRNLIYSSLLYYPP